MKKLVTPILIIIAILAAYWVAFGVNPIKKIFGSSTNDLGTSEDSQTITTPINGTIQVNNSFIKNPTVTQDANGFPLMPGSTGQYVKNMQSALNSRYGSLLAVDGIYGDKTEKALSAHGFQSTVYYKHYNEIIGA